MGCVTEMGKRQSGHFASARRTLQEALLYQERLIHFLDSAGILSQSGGYGGKPHRTTVELGDNRSENLVVHLIKRSMLSASKE